MFCRKEKSIVGIIIIMVIIINGYRYSDKNKREVDYECVYKKQKCKATATRENVDAPWVLKGDHTCQKYYTKKKLLNLAKQQIQEPGIFAVKISNRNVFDNIVLNNADIAGKFKYNSTQRTLRRYKKQVKPHVPLNSTKHTTIKELVEKQLDNLTEPIVYNVHGKTKIMRIDHVTSESRGKTFHHLIFYDPDFVGRFTDECWDMDGTFDSCPNMKDVEQLFTVMAIKEVEIEVKIRNEVRKERVRKPVGLFYSLTSNRTTETYVSIFKHMKECFPALNPKSAMCDYEGASRKAIVIVFPMIILLGCWFHHNQASMKNAVDNHVADSHCNMKNNPKAHWQLKKFQALPLLPADKMKEGFDIVSQETRDMYTIHYINNDLQWVSEVNPFWEAYIKYHGVQWFKRVKPDNVSVYRCLEKTNNFCENAHRHYPEHLGQHKQIQAWIGGLLSMLALNWIILQDIEARNINPPRKSAAQSKKDKLIEECWTKLENGVGGYGIKEFLNEVSRFEINEDSPSIPEEAEKICITYGSYTAKQFAFSNSKELFSAEDLFNAPMIYTNDLEQAKRFCAVAKLSNSPLTILRFVNANDKENMAPN